MASLDGTEICQIFCSDGFTFASSTENQFKCEDGEWTPKINLPECINKSLLGDNDISDTSAVYYPADSLPDKSKPVCTSWNGKHFKEQPIIMQTIVFDKNVFLVLF